MARDMQKRVIKLQFNAPVILMFTIAALAALIADEFTGGAGKALGWTTYQFFSLGRFSPSDFWGYVRLFGHVLGHQDWSHYLSNIVFLLVVGPPLEEKYGSWPMLWCILFTALVSGVVHIIWQPGTILLGASGVVFMLIMLASLAGMRGGVIPITMILVAIIYLGGELAAAFSGDETVSRLTHIAGGLCGTFLGFFMARHKR